MFLKWLVFTELLKLTLAVLNCFQKQEIVFWEARSSSSFYIMIVET